MQIVIRVNEADQRFDRFLRKYFKQNKEVKLTDIYSRIRTGAIKLNGRKAKESTKLVLDDQIDFTGVEEIDKDIVAMTAPKQMRKYNLSSQELKKQILYEDDERIIRNKPSGIVVHEGNFHTNDINLNDYLESYLHYSVKKEKPDTIIDQSVNPRTRQVFKPAFAFRLDKDTS
jgi:23S rRNA pseudouridine955/2504/2580 synthase